MSHPAAFLDRDGVLNHRIPGDTYVTRPEELEVLPHVPEAIRALRARGYRIVVFTNQRGVARGFMDLEDVARIHAKLERVLAEAGAPLDAIYCCPHDNGDGCACRKPLPGMLLDAARDLDLDLGRSVLVGDTPRDLAAGEAAGVPHRFQIESDGDLRQVLGQVPDLRLP
ncbi:MAG: HAD family hydrolase [Planctomycetota bacterium]